MSRLPWAWQATCASPKSVYFFLRSVAGPSSFLNFPNYSSPEDSASFFADFLRSRFIFFQPKTLRSRAKGYLSKVHRVKCLFQLSLLPAEFFATAISPDKAAYAMPNYLPRSDIDFRSWFQSFLAFAFLLLFPLIGRESFSTLCFLPAYLSPPASQSFLNASFYRVYSSF